MKQFLAISSSAINRVNCTKAPDCVSLNRQGCSSKDHTCGKCLSGYIGEDGESNNMCIPLTVLGIATASTSGLETSCTQDSDCQVWQYCNSFKATCSDREKSCPQDCSGHGSCNYFSISSGLEWSGSASCSLFMSTCEGKCQCEEGFVGVDCSLTEEELQSKQALRESLINGLSVTIAADTIDSQSIIGAASTLNSMVSKSDELSAASAFQASLIATEIVKQATEIGTVNYEQITSIPVALDATMSSVLSF
jgi:hypothetical protein